MSLLTNIVSYWKLDNNGNDALGNNNLSSTALSYTSAGKINQGRLSGIGYAPNNSSQNFSDEVSVSLWFKTNVSQSNRYLFSKPKDGATGNNGFDIHVANSNTIGCYIWEGASVKTYHVTMAYTDNNWHHFVVAYKTNNEIKIYIDNVLVLTSAVTGSINVSSLNSLSIGSFNETFFSSLFFNGLIDEVGFWNKKLVASEVTQLYNNSNGLSYPFTRNSSNFLPFFN